MSFLKRLFGKPEQALRTAPLYAAVVAAARHPGWYVEGAVHDTIDGRFEMVAAMLSLALLRLEREGPAYGSESAELTEAFVTDMDGQLRQLGVGDVVVGKHIGKMMSALGGRLGAYRDGLSDGGDLGAALVRNLYRGEAPVPAALDTVMSRLRAQHAALARLMPEALLAGEWPAA